MSSFLQKLTAACLLLSVSLPVQANESLTSGASSDSPNEEHHSSPTKLAQKPAEPSAPLLLKGGVQHNLSPFKEDGSTKTIPEGTAVNVTLQANINSELSKVGDTVCAMVSLDMKDKDKDVVLPGQWQMVGKVTQVQNQHRGGRDGYIEIKFDKLVSPDGKYEVPVDAVVSTKDTTGKTIAKQVVAGSKYASVGAVGGALASVQLGGLGVAISTYGISVGAGAAAGATLGLVAAARREGKILSVVPGDELKVRLSKPLVLPAFNVDALPSAAPPAKLADFDITVLKHQFKPDPFGDKLSSLLEVDFRITNRTKSEYGVGNFAVISDHNQIHTPYALSMDSIKQRARKVTPGATCDTSITFGVASKKYKYRLILLRGGTQHILSEVPIN